MTTNAEFHAGFSDPIELVGLCGRPVLIAGAGGTSPLLAAQLRRVLDVALPESVAIIGDLFARLRRSGLKGSARRMRLLRALADPKIAMMIDRAKNGDRVVRLHGGDPLVFGRGGEEIEALSKTAIPFEIVPGISSILAVAAAAGVPLTLRRIARGFTVRTGHLESGEQAPSLERGEETVLVVMGLGALDRVARRLVDEGRSPDLGAIVVSRASLKDQRIARATLGTIAERVRAADLPSPATLLCGPQL